MIENIKQHEGINCTINTINFFPLNVLQNIQLYTESIAVHALLMLLDLKTKNSA